MIIQKQATAPASPVSEYLKQYASAMAGFARPVGSVPKSSIWAIKVAAGSRASVSSRIGAYIGAVAKTRYA